MWRQFKNVSLFCRRSFYWEKPQIFAPIIITTAIYIYTYPIFFNHLGESENFKKSWPKKLVKSNKSISQNFTLRKNGKYPKKIREIDSFHLTSIFGLDFFKISVPLWSYLASYFAFLARTQMCKEKPKISQRIRWVKKSLSSFFPPSQYFIILKKSAICGIFTKFFKNCHF